MTLADSPNESPLTFGGIGWAWLATIAIDFFFYGGVFAGLFVEGKPSVLSPEQLFARIPAGYASFLIEVVALGWLLRRLSIDNAVASAKLGAFLGITFGAALALGVWSFSPVSEALLGSWWLVLLVQMSAAGWVLGTFSKGHRQRVRKWVASGTFLAVVATVALQNI